MKLHFVVALFLASLNIASATELKWPNANITIAPQIQAFIVEECHKYKGFSEESLQACIRGERYGYQAVITILTDDALGERAAERYRACRAGLGDYGGRFHRRRAECIGSSFRYTWRFEFSRRASVQHEKTIVEVANRQ
jgi:hypothetical protein